ncbi:peroxiredoxin [Oleiagrimonas sp. MCCC 1A03011]|jgi:thioredoxin-dependent peroxiredoxin|uniref:peroxiredoxin n=1 Tax=Oleiagrimonas sp. MCCC 1A03011 TaxID=1926883 RepID=UPI000DC56E94|nr:peroxiredoxin [Oleiagrimonas sp. MCCC 1A03011]RAP59243.1 peroxiredoxin [Oleiagrimonas sp. MCCC 1A03011]
MKYGISLFVAVILVSLAGTAVAALPVGGKAPMFTAQASLGGTVYTYSLAKALQKGPVVVYFYPEAFTKGCTIEAHDFAEAMPKYKALGATVIGVSRDDIEVLKKFSVSECRSKFPVAADPDGSITRSYDAVMPILHKYARRVSYVIAPDGTVIYEYTDLNPEHHVANTLKALRAWGQAHGRGNG